MFITNFPTSRSSARNVRNHVTGSAAVIWGRRQTDCTPPPTPRLHGHRGFFNTIILLSIVECFMCAINYNMIVTDIDSRDIVKGVRTLAGQAPLKFEI